MKGELELDETAGKYQCLPVIRLHFSLHGPEHNLPYLFARGSCKLGLTLLRLGLRLQGLRLGVDATTVMVDTILPRKSICLSITKQTALV